MELYPPTVSARAVSGRATERERERERRKRRRGASEG